MGRTTYIKRSRVNTLTHEYELFRMNPNENIHSMEWQPKVTAISESKDLSSMSLATLFGKLQEHEMELQRLNQNEETDKKKRSISLKASSSMKEENEEDESEDEEDFSLFVKKFKKFVKKRRIERRQNFNNGRKSQEDSQILRCYKCNQLGHIKANFPSNEEWLRKVIRKACIAWDDNDSSDGSEKEINLLTKDYESTLNDDWKFDFSVHDARRLVCTNQADMTGRILAGSLAFESRILHYLIVHILLPRSSNLAQVSEEDLIVMRAFHKGRHFDWAHLVRYRMHKALRLNAPLPYPHLVTLFLKHFNIPLDYEPYVPIKRSFLIGAAMIASFGYRKEHEGS
ncbi:hypothetical protein HKD37_14G040785 [Glycine soja]